MIGKLVRLVRRLIGAAWRALPARLRERAIAEVLHAETEQEPAAALVSLFAAQDRLDLAIGTAAMRYEKGLHPKHRLTDYHRFFVERIADGERVVDVGCGMGAVADSIVRSRAVDVIGIDDDPRSIELARERYRHPRLTFTCGDARRELPAGSCDVVVLSNVLEHLEHRRAFLQTLVARLTPKRVLIRLPLFERAWTVPMRKELGVRWMSDDTHFDEKTQEGWVREIEEAGLSVVHREIRWGEIWCEARPGQSPASSGR